MKLSMMVNEAIEKENDLSVGVEENLIDREGDGTLKAGTNIGKNKAIKTIGASVLSLMILAFAGVAVTQGTASSTPDLGDEAKAESDKQQVHAVRITPDSGITRRLLKKKLRERKLLETIVGATEGNMDYNLDVTGREYLGVTPGQDIAIAFERASLGENVDVQVEYHGVTYLEHLDLQNLQKNDHGAGLQHDALKEEEGGSRRGLLPIDTIMYSGIYLDEYPDQEFQIECAEVDVELDCEVYSVGIFVEPPEYRRKLGDVIIYDEQCEDDEDCPDGQTCYTPRYKAGVSSSYYSKCTCEENSECSFLWQKGGPYRSYFDDYGASDTDHTCGAGDYCVAWYTRSCFSASMTVSTPTGPKKMNELRVNDLVLTGSGSYQKVYAFIHRKPEHVSPMSANYLELITDYGKNSIELTGKHMIYIKGNANPVEARHVKVGDYLSLMEPDSPSKFSKVTGVREVQRKGAFSPLTEDGTIVVNGFVASSFSNPRYADSEYIQIAGQPLVHRATFTQWLTTPVRFICVHVNRHICEADMEAESFMPLFKAAEKSYFAVKNAGMENVAMLAVTLVVMAFYVLENALWIPFLLAASFFALAQVAGPTKKKNKKKL